MQNALEQQLDIWATQIELGIFNVVVVFFCGEGMQGWVGEPGRNGKQV